MKFLHTADIHLDSPLAGLRGRGDLPAGLMDRVTRRAFSAMVDLAIAEDVAFVVIAGDLYDGDWKDFSTGLFFAEEMRRLGRPCFLLRGNHDARSVITRTLTLPGNVREFSTRRCETFTLPELGVALHGHSFPDRAVPEDLSAGYRAPVPGLVNIGVLHTSANDPGEHATYAPCTVSGLARKGYDYWALGHIHDRRILAERPWIVFPGNIQGRHARETGAKGCTIATIADRRIVDVSHRVIDVVRWVSLPVDVTGANHEGVLRRLADAVQDAVTGAAGRPILARVRLVGASDLHQAIAADTDRLIAECRAAAIAADGQLFVEKLRVATRAPSVVQEDLLAPIRQAFSAGLSDPVLVAALQADLARLVQDLPARARGELDVPTEAAGLHGLAEEAWQIVAQALTQDLAA